MRLRWAALLMLALSLLWLGFGSQVRDPGLPDFMPGLRGSIYALLAVQVCLLAGVFVGTALSIRGARRSDLAPDSGYRMTLRGFTAPFVALVAWLLGGGISVGVGLWAALVLGRVKVSTADAARVMVERNATLGNVADDFEKKVRAVNSPAPLIVPPPYVWASVATLLVLVVAVGGGVRAWRRARAAEHAAGRIARARALASLTDAAPGLIATLATVAFGVLAVMAVLFFPDLRRFTGSAWLSQGVAAIAIFVPIALVAGLVLLVIQASRNRQMRRAVAILWDVITFWPRATHPLTPPSYGGRTVWDLRNRMAELVRDPDTRVVLVAHSQGTVIAAATLLQCAKDSEEYPLLTFGAPLRRLYARNFPAYFGPRAMIGLKRRLSRPRRRWINLWAPTDPIGSWVFDRTFVYAREPGGSMNMADALRTVDCRILDVPQGDPDGPICAHSGFWDRDEYGKALDTLQGVVVAEEVDSRAASSPVGQAM